MASDAPRSSSAPESETQFVPPGSEIKHLVHIVLENRSFDSIFGFLYDEDTLPTGKYFRGLAFEGGQTLGSPPGGARSAGRAIPKTNPGLDGPEFVYSSHAGGTDPQVDNDIPARIRKYGPDDKLNEADTKRFGHWPPQNPGEEHEHATVQMYSLPKNTVVDWTAEPTMRGAPYDYLTHGPRLAHAEEVIMTCIPKQLLPTMNMLAMGHAVCDEWFSSVPTQTWPNRLFGLTGSSAHIVNNT